MGQFCDLNNKSDREYEVDSTYYFIRYSLPILCVLLASRILGASRSYSRKILALAKVYVILILVTYITLLQTPTNFIYDDGNPVNETIIKDLRKENENILLQWDPMKDPIGIRLGHVSLFVNGTYMSNWPEYTPDKPYYHVPGVREPIYENEVRWERGQPDRVLVFPKGFLSESSAIAFWEDFLDKKHRYNGVKSNCAHFVNSLLLNCSLVYNLAYPTCSAFIANKFHISALKTDYPYRVFVQSSFAIRVYESGWFWGLFHLAANDTRRIWFCIIVILIVCAIYDARISTKNCVREFVCIYCMEIVAVLALIDIASREGFLNDKFFNMSLIVPSLWIGGVLSISFWKFRESFPTEANSAFMKLVKMDLFSLW